VPTACTRYRYITMPTEIKPQISKRSAFLKVRCTPEEKSALSAFGLQELSREARSLLNRAAAKRAIRA